MNANGVFYTETNNEANLLHQWCFGVSLNSLKMKMFVLSPTKKIKSKSLEDDSRGVIM